MKRYSEEHEWVSLEGSVATLGITKHAAKELGDITFVEPVDEGMDVVSGDVLTVVESVKTAADVYTPVSGTVREFNAALEDSPELINESAEDAGWICRIDDVDESALEGLMTAADYQKFISE